VAAWAGQGANRRMEKSYGGCSAKAGRCAGESLNNKFSAELIDHRPDEGRWFFCARDSWWKSKTKPPMKTKPAIRVRGQNPDHHLWNNNGTFWCHYTEHLPDYTKRRVRRSLSTADRAIARFLRDSVLFEAGAMVEGDPEVGAR